MLDRGVFRIPKLSALVAFESAARHGSFSKAASELQTSQPAISRQIGTLEKELATRLFERSTTGVTLTEPGRRFRDAVAAGLGVIHAGTSDVLSRGDGELVVITCSHDISHLVIFPRLEALQEAMGENTRVRLLTYRDHPSVQPNDPISDVDVVWKDSNPFPGLPDEETAVLFREEVQLICSPEYAAAHAETFAGPETEWQGLTILHLDRPNQGWVRWNDWFPDAVHGFPTLGHERFDTYIQVLEAAATGRGVALGWRHIMDQYLNTGAVVTVKDDFIRYDGRLAAALTSKGRRNPMARKCIEFFRRWESGSGT